jgi:hypothetical protein
MRRVLRLVGNGVDGQSPSFDVMEFIRSYGLVDIVKLGLTLAEGKQLLAQVQRQVVAVQADSHAMLRPDCRSCGGRCHVNDWRPYGIATLFGEVRVRPPGFCVLAVVVLRRASAGHRTAGQPLSWTNRKPGYPH